MEYLDCGAGVKLEIPFVRTTGAGRWLFFKCLGGDGLCEATDEGVGEPLFIFC